MNKCTSFGISNSDLHIKPIKPKDVICNDCGKKIKPNKRGASKETCRHCIVKARKNKMKEMIEERRR